MRSDLEGRCLTLAVNLVDRPIRTYPALLSTEAAAVAWARDGAPHGAVVVAGYQAAPRGRGGRPRHIPDSGFGLSLVARPELSPEREGWLYVAASAGLSDALDGRIDWPDVVHAGGRPLGDVAIQATFDLSRLQWSVVTVAVVDSGPEPARRVQRVVDAIEQRIASDPVEVLRAVRDRVTTLGEAVMALLVPMGPSGPRVEGKAVDVSTDGSLVVETYHGRRVAVRPQHLGRLEIL